MGVFDKQPNKPVSEEQTIEIHLPGRSAQETVIVRTKVSLDDGAWVAAKFSKALASNPKMSMAAQVKLVDRLWLHFLIISWTITKDGEIIPLDPDLESNARWDAIRALPQEEQDYLYAQVIKAQPNRRELGGRPYINPELKKALQSRGKK